MKKSIVILMIFLFSPFVMANENIFMGVDLSKFSPQERAEIIAVVNKRFQSEESKKEFDAKKDIVLSEVDKQLNALKDRGKKYAAIGGAVGVKVVEMASTAGVKVDKFVDDTWTGKAALAAIMYHFTGTYILKILIIISALIVYSYLMWKIIFILSYESANISEEDYQVIQVKKPWYKVWHKGPTLNKRVLTKDMYKENASDEPSGFFLFFLLSTAALVGGNLALTYWLAF